MVSRSRPKVSLGDRAARSTRHEVCGLKNCKFSIDLTSVEIVSFDQRVTELLPDHEFANHILDAKTLGSTELTVRLSKNIYKRTGLVDEFKSPLMVTQTIVVTEPVTAIDREIILPYSPDVQHMHQPKASGGSGQYVWSSDNIDILSFAEGDWVYSRSFGRDVVIRVWHNRNSDNFDEISGNVFEVGSLKALPGPRQAKIEKDLEIALTARPVGSSSLFSNCTALPLSAPVTGAAFRHMATVRPTEARVQPPTDGAWARACWVVRVHAEEKGPAVVIAEATVDQTVKPKPLSVHISAYDSFMVVPSDILIAEGYGLTIHWEGGPSETGNGKSKFSSSVVPEKSDAL
eukprot:381469_1